MRLLRQRLQTLQLGRPSYVDFSTADIREQAPLATTKKKKTVDPYLTQAQQLAAAQLNPSITAVRTQQGQIDQNAVNRADLIRQSYTALADILNPQAGQVEQAYSGAADRQAVYGKGYSLGLQLATQKSAQTANDTLAKQGLPGTVTDQGQAAGDVLYGLGGYSPASVLNTGAAAFKSAALAAPGAAINSGNLLAAGALGQGAQDRAALDAQIAQLEAQRPGLVQQNRADIASQAASAQQQQFENQLAREKLNQPNFFGSSAGGYYAYDPASGQIKQVIAGTGPSPLAPRIVGSDKSGRFAFDPNTGQLTPLISPVAQPKKQRFTAKQISDFKFDATEMARKTFWGVKDPKTGKLVADPLGYQAAMAELLDHGIPLNIAQSALNRYWKRPGYEADVESRKGGQVVWDRATAGGGRPVRPFQERNPGKAGAAAETAANGAVAKILTTAMSAQGVPYVWGGDTISEGGFDCSGLLYWAFGQNGVKIPRTSQTQWRYGKSVGAGDLRPGDAVFFKGYTGGKGGPGHVGIYIGNGNMLVAPRTGDVVKVAPVNSMPGYMGARRFV